MGTKAPQYQLDVQSDDAVTASFNSSNGTGLQSFASKSGGFAVGVYAEADDEQSKAVQGIATATSVINYGVWGQTLSTQGRGVSGLATNGSGVNYGVYGASNSASGYDFYAGGLGVNYGATSSRRWKNNIVAIDHPLEKLAELRGVYFDWDEAHGGRHDIGMIAEEVGAVLPEIVSFEDNGVDASGMDYSKLTPLLVEAVNALRAENVTLRSMNDQQRSELSSLTARMAKLEEMIGKVKGSE